MPRISNSANNRIARTNGIRQQRQYSFGYPHRTGRFKRASNYRNVPVPAPIALTHNQINLNEISKNGNIRTVMLKTSLIRKTPAYPTKRINKFKKRISAKDGDADFKFKVISATESCFNGCLGWTGLASLLRAPLTTPFTKGRKVGESIPARRWHHRILYESDSITDAEWPSSTARSTGSFRYKATCKGTVGRTGTPSLDCAQVFHLCNPLLYL